VLHLGGPGDDFESWNNTGVHRDFAVAAGSVRVPTGWTPAAANEVWTVYAPSEPLLVAVHSHEGVGVMALFHSGDAETVLDALSTANPDPLLLQRTYTWPEGPVLTYNVHAPRNQWVLVAVDAQPLNRHFDRWPLLDGVLD
jgi:hypothetical protein